MAQQLKEIDPKKREAILHDLQKIVLQEKRMFTLSFRLACSTDEQPNQG